MENDPTLKRAKEILDDLPTTPFSEESKKLLHEEPLDWASTRNRQMRAALLEGDQEQVDLIKDDVAHVLGKKAAEWWMLSIMEHLVFEEIEEDIDLMSHNGQ